MANQKLTWGIVALLIVIIAAVAVYFVQFYQGAEQPAVVEQPEEAALEEPAAEQAPDLCADIEDETDKDDCYCGQAIGAGDIALTEVITSDFRKQQCFMRIMVLKGDPALCGGMSDAAERDDCFVAMAISRDDNSFCDELSGAGHKEDCRLVLFMSSSKESNKLDCAALSSSGNKAHCHRTLAMRERDPGLCDKIEDAAARESCHAVISEMPEEESRPRCEGQECHKAAIMEGPTICDVVDPEKADDCNMMFRKVTGEESLCQKVSDDAKRDICINSPEEIEMTSSGTGD